MMRLDSRLVLALDETDREKALRVLDQVSDCVDAVKINWPLVLSSGPGIIDELSRSVDVICDFKVADIPNTVSLIVSQSVKRGASAVIVHAFTGEDSLQAALAAAGQAEVYAVTEMSHPGAVTFTAPHAEEMARMAMRCGVHGFIAPATRPDRLRAIRALVGDRKILSPGVGAQGGSASAAIEAGATYVIVGRAIYGAEDPAEVAHSLVRELEGPRS
jgi:orotidine-5'-phosphate decarboxylase